MTNLEVLFSAIVNVKVDNEESFSAYDITKAARSCTTTEVDHLEVRDFVHDYMLDIPNYNGSNNGTYIVYSPMNNQPDGVDDTVPQDALGVYAVPNTTSRQLIIPVKSKKRVTIQRNELNKICSGDKVYFDGKTLGDKTVCPNGTEYTKEHGYVRVKVDKNPGDSVSFKVGSDRMEVE